MPVERSYSKGMSSMPRSSSRSERSLGRVVVSTRTSYGGRDGGRSRPAVGRGDRDGFGVPVPPGRPQPPWLEKVPALLAQPTGQDALPALAAQYAVVKPGLFVSGRASTVKASATRSLMSVSGVSFMGTPRCRGLLRWGSRAVPAGRAGTAAGARRAQPQLAAVEAVKVGQDAVPAVPAQKMVVKPGLFVSASASTVRASATRSLRSRSGVSFMGAPRCLGLLRFLRAVLFWTSSSYPRAAPGLSRS